jgi:hypothetical protein
MSNLFDRYGNYEKNHTVFLETESAIDCYIIYYLKIKNAIIEVTHTQQMPITSDHHGSNFPHTGTKRRPKCGGRRRIVK